MSNRRSHPDDRFYVTVPAKREGPWGPHTFTAASQLARIGSGGGHEREVWQGRPHAEGSHLARRYARGEAVYRDRARQLRARANRYAQPTRTADHSGDVYHEAWVAGSLGDAVLIPEWASRLADRSLAARYALEEGWADGVQSAREVDRERGRAHARVNAQGWWSPAAQQWAEVRLNRATRRHPSAPSPPGGPLDESLQGAIDDGRLHAADAERMQHDYEAFAHHAPRHGLIDIPTPRHPLRLVDLGGHAVAAYNSKKHIEPGDERHDRKIPYVHCVVADPDSEGKCRNCGFTAAQGEHEGGGELARVFGPATKGIRANGKLTVRHWPKQAVHLADATSLGILTDRGVAKVRFNPPAYLLQIPGTDTLMYLPRKKGEHVYIAAGGDMRITPDGIAG